MGRKGGVAAKGGAKGGRGKNAAAQQAKREEAIAAWKKRQQIANAARREESEFTRLDPATLERLNLHATYDLFPRPIPGRLATFSHEAYEYEFGPPESQARAASVSGAPALSRRQQEQRLLPRLQLPKKPKWNRDMSTKAVQSNEKEAFRTWLQKSDDQVNQFFRRRTREEDQEAEEKMKEQEGASSFLAALKKREGHEPEDPESEEEDPVRKAASARARSLAAQDPYCPQIPTQYERNLFVYQQLWRVVDRSHILLVLMDVRAAHLHLPPSLQAYLQHRAHNRVRRTILVLTKTDLVTPQVTQEWVDYLSRKFAQWSVVPTSSYLRLEPLEGQGQRVRTQPFISDDSHARLIDAIQKEYNTLLQQPPGCESRDEHSLGKVDFDRLRRGAVSEHDMVPGAADAGVAHKSLVNKKGKDQKDPHPPSLPADLVIGCVGQPNVGKSSLINALFGARRARASKTPGKTKHYQTHVLASRPPCSPDSRLSESEIKAGDPSFSRVVLCDSPGLVFPMFSGLEMQVLAGVYNIAHVQAASTCVQFVGQRMPLEEVYRLAGPVEDSDTLRGMRTRKHDPREVDGSTPWTAGLFLECVAHRRGFRTAKAARLDTNRAANWVLKSLAEGRVHWAFRPPTDGAPPPDTADGIWLRELDSVNNDEDGSEEEEDGEKELEEDDCIQVNASDCGHQDSRSPPHKRHGQSPQGIKGPSADEAGMTWTGSEDEDELESEAESESEDAAPVNAAASRFAALQIDGDD